MSNTISMKEPCPCGSGELYRNCCGRNVLVKRRQKRNLLIGIVLAAAVIVPALGYMYKLDQQKREELTLPPGSYYSEGHKHWHDADDQEILIPGYVWSPTKMRWLKVTDSLIEQLKAEEARSVKTRPDEQPAQNLPDAQRNVPEPPGEAPEGKVWSEEHGHYHDADGKEV